MFTFKYVLLSHSTSEGVTIVEYQGEILSLYAFFAHHQTSEVQVNLSGAANLGVRNSYQYT